MLDQNVRQTTTLQHVNALNSNLHFRNMVLKENMTNKLMMFERRIMRKIFGPTRTDNGYWRIKTDREINYILKEQNVILVC